MERFLERHKDRILGVLSGFDRLMFRGTIRSLSHLTGFDMFLSSQGIRYKDYGAFVQRASARLKEHAKAIAAQRQRAFLYVASTDKKKGELAEKIMSRDGITDGLVCVLSCVELFTSRPKDLVKKTRSHGCVAQRHREDRRQNAEDAERRRGKSDVELFLLCPPPRSLRLRFGFALFPLDFVSPLPEDDR